MSDATAVGSGISSGPSVTHKSGNAFTDAMLMTWRNLKQIPRVPDKLMYGTIQPIMFVVLFAYVFGGAIPVGGQSSPSTYREFLMAGIFAQTMAFSVASSSAGGFGTSRNMMCVLLFTRLASSQKPGRSAWETAPGRGRPPEDRSVSDRPRGRAGGRPSRWPTRSCSAR